MQIEVKSASDLRQVLLNIPYGLEVKLPKNLEDTILTNLHESSLGKLRGAKKDFRDFNKIDSLHIKVYENCLKAHIDKKNPIYQPLQHLWEDAKDVIGLLILAFNLVFVVLTLGIIFFL